MSDLLIATNGFGISEVAEGIAKQYREAISRIPCYAMSRPKGATRRTGIISEAVMAKGSDRRERFRHNVADMRSFAHSLLKFNNYVRNLGERSATSEPHIVLLYAPSRPTEGESAAGRD